MNVDYRGAYVKKDIEEENWWQRRSGLEQKLIILFIVSTLFSSGCLLYIILKHSPAQEICSSPTCLSIASDMTSHMDLEADPCEDFYMFVCGKFSDDISGNLREAHRQQLADKVEAQLEEILEEPIDNGDHYLINSQKELLQACVNDTGAEDSFDIFQQLLDDIDGWPVVKNFAWRARFFDWIDLMYVFRKRGYPYSMMLNIGVEFSADEPEDANVFISDPFVESIEDDHKNEYKNYMVDVAVMFGADRHRAEIEMPEVLEFMDKMRKIAEFNQFNETIGPLATRYVLNEYQERHDEIEWLEFINNILYPTSSITSDDYVVFPRDEYIKAFFSLIGSTTKRVQANYMIWTVLNQMIPYMSEELKSLKEKYHCLTEKQSANHDRMEFCKKVLQKRPFRILYARKYLPIEKKEQVEELFGRIKSEFMTALTEAPWMDEESATKAVEKLDQSVDIIGAPGDYFNNTIFEVFDDTIDFDGSSYNASFFSMYLELNKRKSDFLYTYLDISVNGTFFHGWSTNTRVRYLSKTNIIVLPAGFFQENFYDEQRPMYLNYASAGTEMAFRLAWGFSEDENDVWSNDTALAFKEYKKCVSNEGEELFNLHDIHETNDFSTVEESISEYTSTKVAYRAYKKWVSDNVEEAVLAGTEYSPDQLFWISAMSLKCFKLNGEEGLPSNSTMYRIYQANGPFRNNPDFTSDFNCPLDSEMNPSEKCESL